jgi:hypothetical protein
MVGLVALDRSLHKVIQLYHNVGIESMGKWWLGVLLTSGAEKAEESQSQGA